MARQILTRLKPLLDMPFADKLAISEVIVARALSDYAGRCVVSFSGGKDSQLALLLALRVNPDVPVIFEDTGIEYPETLRFVYSLVDKWHLNITITKPERTFWDCVSEHGFPKTKNNRGYHKGNVCCYHLKDRPFLLAMREHGWSCVITGVTAPESRQRQMLALTHGTCYTTKHDGIHKVHPILYWLEEEVRAYLLSQGQDINPMYHHSSGTVDRIGCSCCTAYATWEEQLSAVNPKLYALIKKRIGEP